MDILILGVFEREFEREGRPSAGTFTVDLERPSQFFRGQCAAMKAEAVPVFACGESVTENASEILLFNPDAIIGHLYLHPIFVRINPDNEILFRAP
jgi:hypothetical protein